jgi:hypothetical protein
VATRAQAHDAVSQDQGAEEAKTEPPLESRTTRAAVSPRAQSRSPQAEHPPHSTGEPRWGVSRTASSCSMSSSAWISSSCSTSSKSASCSSFCSTSVGTCSGARTRPRVSAPRRDPSALPLCLALHHPRRLSLCPSQERQGEAHLVGVRPRQPRLAQHLRVAVQG